MGVVARSEATKQFGVSLDRFAALGMTFFSLGSTLEGG
jgi:hypothetical protein